MAPEIWVSEGIFDVLWPRFSERVSQTGDDLFKVMANEPPHVKANFLKYVPKHKDGSL